MAANPLATAAAELSELDRLVLEPILSAFDRFAKVTDALAEAVEGLNRLDDVRAEQIRGLEASVSAIFGTLGIARSNEELMRLIHSYSVPPPASLKGAEPDTEASTAEEQAAQLEAELREICPEVRGYWARLGAVYDMRKKASGDA